MAKILITDDSTFARLALRKLVLELRPDWEIDECSSPTEALARMQERGVDAVLIDYHMPQMNGLALAANLIKTYDGLEVALVTANLREKLKDQSEQAGVHYIAKPVTSEKLVEFLDSVVG